MNAAVPGKPGYQTLPQRAERTCRVVEWKPWPFPNPHLIGHAAVSFSGWVVHDVPVFRTRDGSLSVGVPNAAQIDAEGRAKTDARGKRQFTSILTFETEDAKERWRALCSPLCATPASGTRHEQRV
jgi:hypothetical protein